MGFCPFGAYSYAFAPSGRIPRHLTDEPVLVGEVRGGGRFAVGCVTAVVFVGGMDDGAIVLSEECMAAGVLSVECMAAVVVCRRSG